MHDLSLTNIVIEYRIACIKSHHFYNCSNLTSISFTDSVPSIGPYTFYNCSCLTSIVIPDSVSAKSISCVP